MRRTMLLTLAALLIVMLARTQAVTDGKLDGNAHPAVVLLLMEVEASRRSLHVERCYPATVLLTAGHCTNNFPAVPIPACECSPSRTCKQGSINNYPFAGPNSVEAVHFEAHPLYETAPFFVHDVGVVVLEEPGVVLPASQYGVLPSADQLDSLKKQRGQKDVTFTAVGYGLQESFPDPASFLANNSRTRYSATPRLLQINVPGFTGGFAMLLSNNHNTGGTCFGDSGGANFLGSGPTETKIVAGITSFGLNGNCAGTGGVFRTDRQDVLDFVNAFLP